MRFAATPLAGAWVIEIDRLEDERGHFARTFDREEWLARDMDPTVLQCSVSFNRRAGTLRGMHLQSEPHGETKLVSCSAGAIFDVIVDLRADSPTHRAWFGVELSAANGRALYIPTGMAHGFQTLRDDSEVRYMMGRPHVAQAATGVRWDDPAFAIDWPAADERTISERDRSYPDYAP